MNTIENAQFCCGEVVPRERLDLQLPQSLIESLASSITRIGYKVEHSDSAELLCSLQSVSTVESFTRSKFAPESQWFLAHFTSHIWVKFGADNIFFGLLSRETGEAKSPFGITARDICQQMGSKDRLQSLSREILSYALADAKQRDYADILSVQSSFPPESALSADIVVVPDALLRDMRLAISKDVTLHSFRFLDSLICESSNLLKLLNADSPPEHIALAQCRPYLLSAVAKPSVSVQDIFHHYEIACMPGRLGALVDELLAVAISLQWRWAKNHSELAEDQATKNAIAQLNRMRSIEDTWSSIANSLHILQRKFPVAHELLELEIDNQYAVLCKYSPSYRHWRDDLRRYIDKYRGGTHSSTNTSLLDLNWKVLVQHRVATSDDASRILSLMDVDPPSTLTRIRVIIEKIVNTVYWQQAKGRDCELGAKLHYLNEKNVFPPLIYLYLNTIRLAGNIGAHSTEGSKEEVQALLPVFICVVEWYVDREYNARQKNK